MNDGSPVMINPINALRNNLPLLQLRYDRYLPDSCHRCHDDSISKGVALLAVRFNRLFNCVIFFLIYKNIDIHWFFII